MSSDEDARLVMALKEEWNVVGVGVGARVGVKSASGDAGKAILHVVLFDGVGAAVYAEAVGNGVSLKDGEFSSSTRERT